MICQRFDLEVYISRHAPERMMCRSITEWMLSELLETGDIRSKDPLRLWVAKHFQGRADNLICAAVAVEEKLVIKTVMHHFRWEV